MAKIIIKMENEAAVAFLRGGHEPQPIKPVRTTVPVGHLRACNLPILPLTQGCFQDIGRHLMPLPPEVGGWLLGPMSDPVATHFVLDSTGQSSAAAFTFDHKRLNELLQKFVALRLDAKGVIHSHPSGCTRLSNGDLTYAKKIFSNPKNDAHEIYMPIVVDGHIHPYIVYRDNPDDPQPAQLVLY